MPGLAQAGIEETREKRAFTLLELIVIIVIIGVLTTLGLMQYQTTIKKSRDAEARNVLAYLRIQCAAIYLAERDTNNCNAGNLRIGTASDMIPSECRPTHFFQYATNDPAAGSTDVTLAATRCTSGGKEPNINIETNRAYNIILTTEYAVGTDIWSGELY